MRKLSKRHLYKISKREIDPEDLISKMRESVKEDENVIEKFEEYGVPLDDIDSVEICFWGRGKGEDDLGVSAKTKDKKIYLNSNMLSKEDPFEFAVPYVAHELIHYLQQLTGKNLTKKKTDEYLDKPTEEEAFQVQVQFKKDHEGEEDAEEYVDKLLDYHDLTGKKRTTKRRKLLDG